jgi:hypothetical protein
MMNPLHLEALARDRMVERERTIASWAIARAIRPVPPSAPAPLPPLPPSPRLRGPRRGGILGWFRRARVLLAGAVA